VCVFIDGESPEKGGSAEGGFIRNATHPYFEIEYMFLLGV